MPKKKTGKLFSHATKVDVPQRPDWIIYGGDGDELVNIDAFGAALTPREDNGFQFFPIILSSHDIKNCKKIDSRQPGYTFAVMPRGENYGKLQLAITFYFIFLTKSGVIRGYESLLKLDKHTYDDYWLHLKPVEAKHRLRFRELLKTHWAGNRKVLTIVKNLNFYYVDAVVNFSMVSGGYSGVLEQMMFALSGMEDPLEHPHVYLKSVCKHPAAPKNFISDNWTVWESYYCFKKIRVDDPISGSMQAQLDKIKGGR